ncbi:hypothetical protein AWB69_08425 [Caballeronia udeis]|uniref:Uncharacterized protein n=1 Tax=Caballeronia udeis TaxID=1232866 RepID=A0A158JPZ3_9BURK|nr:hypothetical protein AWB69_08425 [Caballeronia udeis]
MASRWRIIIGVLRWIVEKTTARAAPRMTAGSRKLDDGDEHVWTLGNHVVAAWCVAFVDRLQYGSRSWRGHLGFSPYRSARPVALVSHVGAAGDGVIAVLPVSHFYSLHAMTGVLL